MPNPLFDTLLASHRVNESNFLTDLDGNTRSYAIFFENVLRTANALGNCGLKRGDRLAIQVEKSFQSLEIYMACVASGIIFLPLNTAYTINEVSYFLEDATPKVFICDPAQKTEFIAKTTNPKLLIYSLAANGTGSFSNLVVEQPANFKPVDLDAHDVAALLYTSGTTGRSKGAMLTHRNLLSNAEILVEQWRITADDTLLHALPIFHTHGLFVAVNTTLLAGSSMIFLPNFKIDTVINNLPKTTIMMGVPTFYTRLLDDPRFNKNLVKNVRLFISGSAPLLPETHKIFETRTGHYILERYGMTETNMNTSNPFEGERRAGTVGFPLPDIKVRIMKDGQEAEVQKGEVGMIEVNGPNVFKGYWKMPEKTAEELRDNGFLITGDLGYIDEDNYLHIVGRKKDLIISGGYNIYPKEVELVLDDLPGVLESAVIGVPHPDFGEAVIAVLVASPNSNIDISNVHAKLELNLAKYKQPKKLFLIKSLPRNTMRKVQKNSLRDTHKNLFMTV